MTCFRGSLRFFFHSCGSFEDNTSWQHTFSFVSFLPCFIFKVHNFFSNCLSQNILYPNLTRFLVRANFSKITSLDKTPSILFHFSLALHPRYIDCFQIIKLQTVKLTKHFLFKDGGPVFYLCPLWLRDVHSMSALHMATLRKPHPLSLHWAWHGRCWPPHCLRICWPRG